MRLWWDLLLSVPRRHIQLQQRVNVIWNNHNFVGHSFKNNWIDTITKSENKKKRGTEWNKCRAKQSVETLRWLREISNEWWGGRKNKTFNEKIELVVTILEISREEEEVRVAAAYASISQTRTTTENPNDGPWRGLRRTKERRGREKIKLC